MTRENAKALLPIIQAFAEGQTIQNISCNGQSWLDVIAPSFSGPPHEYRIKPPREWWIVFREGCGSWVFSNKGSADMYSGKCDEIVHVREVLE